MTRRLPLLLLLVWLLIKPIWVFAQTCKSTIPETTATARFTDQNDGTVLDTETQLVWKRCSEGQTWDSDNTTCTGSTTTTYNWLTAFTQVDTVNNTGFAGQTDWRLPNHKELRSIVEYKCENPAINETVFPNASSAYFWTSSPWVFNPQVALSIYFSTGEIGYYSKNFERFSIRLVRAGQ